MWGMTQHVVKDVKISAVCMMFNEFEVMQQIYREQARGCARDRRNETKEEFSGRGRQ